MNIKKIEINENGMKMEYDVLFTIKNESNNKEFIIYTDIDSDIDIYAALYNEKEKRLEYIEDENDRKMIEEMIEIIKNNINS